MNARVKFLLSLCFLIICSGISAFLKKNFTPKSYVFDMKYSIFLQDPQNVSYTTKKTIQTSRETEVFFSKIMTPVFFCEKDNQTFFLSEKGEIIENVAPNQVLKLIKLECDNFSLVKESYKLLKKLPLKSMVLIDNRRWRVEYIAKDGKIITVEFPDLNPNLDEFFDLEKKYELSKKYSTIDLRFRNKIGILDKN